MSLIHKYDHENEKDVAHRNLIKVTAFLGGITKTVKILNTVLREEGDSYELTVSTYNNWLNRGDEFQLKIATILSSVSGFGLHSLVPTLKGSNSCTIIIFQRKRCFEIPIAKVRCNNPHALRDIAEERPVIVDEDFVLISGLARVERYKAKGLKRIPVQVIDLGGLFANPEQSFYALLGYSKQERIAMICRFEQMIQEMQDWIREQKKAEKNPKDALYDCPNWDNFQSSENKEEIIAKLFGFKEKDLVYHAKELCLNATPGVLDAFEQDLISVYQAAELAQLPAEQQLEHLEAYFSRCHAKRAVSFKTLREEYA
jgi:hypothetical protein